LPHLDERVADRNTYRLLRRELSGRLALNADFGARWLADHLQAAQVAGDGFEGGLDRGTVLLDPGVGVYLQRGLQVDLSVDPATKLLFGKTHLRKRPRALGLLIRFRELAQRLLVLTLFPKLDASTNRGFGAVRGCEGAPGH